MMRLAGESDDRSDADLVASVASGQTSALGQLAMRHQQRVRAIAYRILGRWDLADDVAQEAFLRVWRGAERYQPSAAFTTWLYRIVVNLCLDQKRRGRPLQLTEQDPPDDRVTHTSLIDLERTEAVRREVAALPERQRVALVLHRFEGLNHAQIAAATGWSESAIESLLVRAYARLRETLKDWVPP
jgi:RNA polymerase sigma-70 factor (ECF subfamily)